MHLVREFHLAEGDGLLHPVGAEVGGVWVDVDGGSAGGLSLASRHPVAVHVLPALLVDGTEVDQHGVHGARVEAGYRHADDGEHPAARRHRKSTNCSTQ